MRRPSSSKAAAQARVLRGAEAAASGLRAKGGSSALFIGAAGVLGMRATQGAVGACHSWTRLEFELSIGGRGRPDRWGPPVSGREGEERESGALGQGMGGVGPAGWAAQGKRKRGRERELG